VLVGAAAAGVAALSGGWGLRTEPAPPAATHTDPPPNFDKGWDPVEQEAAFGWLPSWVDGVSYQSGAGDAQAAVATSGVHAGAGAPGLLWLTVSQQEPALAPAPGGGKAEKTSAPPVNGLPAFWISSGGRASLEWQVDGAWAYLSGESSATADETLRIAAGVTVATKPMPLPLHIEGLPAGFPISGGNMLRGSWAHGAKWSLDLMFRSGDDQTKQNTDLNIRVGPKGTVAPDPRSVCKSDRELEVCAEFTGPEPTALAASGGVAGLLDRITLLGTDPKYWTTHVIG
jgi:hypothetical protein